MGILCWQMRFSPHFTFLFWMNEEQMKDAHLKLSNCEKVTCGMSVQKFKSSKVKRETFIIKRGGNRQLGH